MSNFRALRLFVAAIRDDQKELSRKLTRAEKRVCLAEFADAFELVLTINQEVA